MSANANVATRVVPVKDEERAHRIRLMCGYVLAVTLIAGGRGVPFGQIQISDDGTNFRTIVELPGAVQYRAGRLKTYAFPETTARFIRVRMTGAAPGPDAVINQTETSASESQPRVTLAG